MHRAGELIGQAIQPEGFRIEMCGGLRGLFRMRGSDVGGPFDLFERPFHIGDPGRLLPAGSRD